MYIKTQNNILRVLVFNFHTFSSAGKTKLERRAGSELDVAELRDSTFQWIEHDSMVFR